MLLCHISARLSIPAKRGILVRVIFLEEKRLNKFIADSGHCSRREADRLIEEGRVTVDGRPGVLGDKVEDGMVVEVDGRPLSGRGERVYIALYKPVGIVSTADPREPYNVVSYLNYPVRVFPVGRLDRDSEGLLLLTSDGEIVNRLLRAAGGHEREYEVEVDRPVTREFLEKMMKGVPILDTVTLPCRARRTGDKSFNIVLVQGLNRQIRRMCEALGYNVKKLRRVRILDIRLGDMQPGRWRLLTPREMQTLERAGIVRK
ncbi:MAG: Ribosomal large subunit pseudouridine synthase F [Firmicutes bacterium ADurb.Bin467]|jgi:23S rRNA pseudouridine2604 synthase|nr:MAG: Ribosomal large subunit pseudouridine synthase F [Firmicutes bacterium ADurb.Bin467]